MRTPDRFDIVIVGGGINGAGIAADAVGRGLSVCLLEKGDLAGATSSASSKLIHGGLRYLEHREFGLVREALVERERLLQVAPHIISPLRFVLPHVESMRPRWLLRLGLHVYDHLARRQTLPASRSVQFKTDPSGPFLRSDLTRGFSYWDCWVDDARLVILNARAAAQKGADIRTRSEVTRFHPDPENTNTWTVHFKSGATEGTVTGRVVVNASGPWADRVAALETNVDGNAHSAKSRKVRLVKGSHIVVPRHYYSPDAFVLQNVDGRVVFVLPYEEAFTLIGTTDEAFDGDPGEACCSPAETRYLVDVANRFLARKLKVDDVVHQFSGVRPLYDDDEVDPSKISRDYRLEFRPTGQTPPLLTVLGGKITTYRHLAERAVNLLSSVFEQAGPAWTAGHPLPGGAFETSFDHFKQRLSAHYPQLESSLLTGVGHRHGVNAYTVLGDGSGLSDPASQIMPGLTRREIHYLRDFEWAQTAEDILWRRTKFGLHLTGDRHQKVEAEIEACLAA